MDLDRKVVEHVIAVDDMADTSVQLSPKDTNEENPEECGEIEPKKIKLP